MGKTHTKTPDKIKEKHKRVEEACLSGHQGQLKKGDTCSYRWQAYLQAKLDSGLYNWPAYKSISKEGKNAQVKTAAYEKGGKKIPSWYKFELDPPGKNEWNLDEGDNFTKCYLPYWHEAHHVIPKGTLQHCLNLVGDGAKDPSGAKLAVFGGLLDEGYNVNNKLNMIILPMDWEVARALQLPKHRKTPQLTNHPAYNGYVFQRLDEFFDAVREAAKEHENPKYEACREKLEKLSDKLYRQIVEAGKMMVEGDMDSLDDMAEQPQQPPTKKQKTTPKSVADIDV